MPEICNTMTYEKKKTLKQNKTKNTSNLEWLEDSEEMDRTQCLQGS